MENLLKILNNSLIKKGKKIQIEKLSFNFLKNLKAEVRQDPISVLNLALFKAKPVVTLKGKKVAGVSLKIPTLIANGKDFSISIKWFVQSSLLKIGNDKLNIKLVREVLDILANKGATIKKRNELHKLALSNRPFLKYL